MIEEGTLHVHHPHLSVLAYQSEAWLHIVLLLIPVRSDAGFQALEARERDGGLGYGLHVERKEASVEGANTVLTVQLTCNLQGALLHCERRICTRKRRCMNEDVKMCTVYKYARL